MAEKDVPVDTAKLQSNLKGAIPRLQEDILSVLFLTRIDLDDSDIGILNVLLLLITLGFCNYVAYIIGSLLRIQILAVLTSILFPLGPFIGIFYMLLYSYCAASIYMFLLSEQSRGLRDTMYVVLLGCVHLPIGIVLVNFAAGIVRIMSPGVYFLISVGTFGLIAIISDFICRRNLMRGRSFSDNKQRIQFILVSLIMNIGALGFIFPLFYVP